MARARRSGQALSSDAGLNFVSARSVTILRAGTGTQAGCARLQNAPRGNAPRWIGYGVMPVLTLLD
jgi:hypothetical protein